MRVSISGGTGAGHVSVWDLEKLVCTELYLTSTEATHRKLSARDMELVNLGDEKNEAILSRVVASSKEINPSRSPGIASGAVRSFVISTHVPEDGSEPRQSFLLSAGPDYKVRFWDPDRMPSSLIVNGVEPNEPTASFTASLVGADTKAFICSTGNSTDADQSETRGSSPTPSSGRTSKAISTTGSTRDEGKKSSSRKSAAGGSASKMSRYDVIRASAGNLLNGHKGDITCLALLERPFGMVVSCDRAGMIMVYQ